MYTKHFKYKVWIDSNLNHPTVHTISKISPTEEDYNFKVQCFSVIMNAIIEVVSAQLDCYVGVLKSVQFPQFKTAFLSCLHTLITNVLPHIQHHKTSDISVPDEHLKARLKFRFGCESGKLFLLKSHLMRFWRTSLLL